MSDPIYEAKIEAMARAMYARDYDVCSSREPPTFGECDEWYLEQARAAAEAIGLREGSVIVPREPTEAMRRAGVQEYIRPRMSVQTDGRGVRSLYAAMIAVSIGDN